MRIHQALRGMKKGPAPAPSKFLTYQTFVSSATDSTTYTFSNVTLGTEYSDRVLIVLVFGVQPSSNAQIQSVKINGTVMSNVSADTYGGVIAMRYAYEPIPTGTTGTVEVTFASTVISCGVAVFSSTQSQMYMGNGNIASTTQAAITVGFGTGTGGHTIGMAVQYNNPVRTISSFSGYTTKHVDTVVDSFSRVFVGSAYPTTSTTQTLYTVTFSATSTLQGTHAAVNRY